jgi:hypothetical protein
MPPKKVSQAAMPPKNASQAAVPADTIVARVSVQLAEIIRNTGEPPIKLARAAKVAPSVLSRFLAGERGLTTESIDRIAEALGGLWLVRPKAPKKPRKG